MAYRLNEIIFNTGDPTNDISANTFLTLNINNIPKCNPIPKSKFNKKIIFECSDGLAFGCSLATTNNIDNWQSNKIISSFTYVYWKIFGYTSNSRVLYINKNNMNTYNQYAHIIIDPSEQTISMYNTINRGLFFKTNCSGYYSYFINTSDNICIGLFSAGGKRIEINPDVESFAVKPFVEHDIDLYSAVLDLPYTPVVFNNTNNSKNIISLL